MATQVRNVSKGTVVALHLSIARTFWARLLGLLGSAGLPAGHGLLLRPASSIHTLFMRFAIDALFIDRGGRVVRAVPGLPPFRLALGGRGARAVLELPPGTIATSGTAPGDQLAIDVIDGSPRTLDSKAVRCENATEG